MYQVRVEADFAAAHFLRDYHGKCENLHGHNYKVFAHVKGTVLNEGGMLLDFSILKGILKKVCSSLDHTNLNDMPVFCQNPSAERIAKYIFDSIIEEAAAQGINLKKNDGRSSDVCTDDTRSSDVYTSDVWLSAVDVFETETSRARYSV